MADNTDLLTQLLALGNSGTTDNNRLKTTTIPGYVLWCGFGMLSTIEKTEKGDLKAHFLCPFVGMAGLNPDLQPATSPVVFRDSNMVFPKNFSLKIPRHINHSQLNEGQVYCFTATYKPGAINGNRGASAVAYYDGYLFEISEDLKAANSMFQMFKEAIGKTRIPMPPQPE